MWSVSFGFSSVAMPSNDGIINAENPSKKLLFKMIKFFITVTMAWKQKREKNLDEFEFFLFRLFKTGFCWSVTHHDNDHDLSWNFTCGAIRRNVLILQFDAIFSLRFGLSFLSAIFSEFETINGSQQPKNKQRKFEHVKKVNVKSSCSLLLTIHQFIDTVWNERESCWWETGCEWERTQHSTSATD